AGGGVAFDDESAVQRLDPVPKATKTVAVGVCATHTVIHYLDRDLSDVVLHVDLDSRGSSVLRDVRERLCGDEVCRRLYRRRKPALAQGEINRNGCAAG